MIADVPLDSGELVRWDADQLDLRAEERHWEVAGQVHPFPVEANAYRESFHEKLAAGAVEQGPGTKEQGDGSIDGGLGSAVPSNPEARSAELEGAVARNGKLQRAQHHLTVLVDRADF